MGKIPHTPRRARRGGLWSFSLGVVISILATLLVSASGICLQTAESKLSFCSAYLLAGERMFRSRELEGAREAFEKVLELDGQEAQAHYFLGLIEYEEGNVGRAKARLQVAHECLPSWLESSQLQVPGLTGDTGTKTFASALPNAKQVQLEFPDGYEARIYYKDGWYVRSKKIADEPISLLTLEAHSTYRIELKSERKESWVRRGMIGFLVALSFFLAR
jgi:tetratricopeptide (TPR) repeat protein